MAAEGIGTITERAKRKPGPVSREWLMRAGAHYLERYATSSENFRRVLDRKVRRRMMLREEEMVDHSALVGEIVARFAELGFLDDRTFAEAKLRSLRRKGHSTRMIEAKLSEKGVDRDTIERVVGEDETSDRSAAQAYAKRRRLGPWRFRSRAERRDRDVAAMMRAGFSYGLAVAVIDEEGRENDVSAAPLDGD